MCHMADIFFFDSDPGVVSASHIICTNTNLVRRTWLADPIHVVSGSNINIMPYLKFILCPIDLYAIVCHNC
jgi:hypothetical protein